MVFLLSVTPFLSLLLFYKKVRNWQKRCRSTVTASNYVTRKQLLAHMNIIMKHTHIDNRHDVLHVCFFTSSATKSRLMVVSRVAKKNAHAMTTESLFTCTKMYKKWKTKLTFLVLQSFLFCWNIFIIFSIVSVKNLKVNGASLPKIW